MLCPQCGKSIENHSAKVTLCEACSEAQKTAEFQTGFVPEEEKKEDEEPVKEEKLKPQLKPTLKINLSRQKFIIIASVFIFLLVIIIVSQLIFKKDTSVETSRKKSHLLESFSDEKLKPVPSKSPEAKPSEVMAVATDEVNLKELEKSITNLEAAESKPSAIVATSSVLIPSQQQVRPSPSPSPSPSPEIDEFKLSEFDRRVLRAKRLKELENK